MNDQHLITKHTQFQQTSLKQPIPNLNEFSISTKKFSKVDPGYFERVLNFPKIILNLEGRVFKRVSDFRQKQTNIRPRVFQNESYTPGIQN